MKRHLIGFRLAGIFTRSLSEQKEPGTAYLIWISPFAETLEARPGIFRHIESITYPDGEPVSILSDAKLILYELMNVMDGVQMIMDH